VAFLFEETLFLDLGISLVFLRWTIVFFMFLQDFGLALGSHFFGTAERLATEAVAPLVVTRPEGGQSCIL
jgi:hypothetical protein